MSDWQPIETAPHDHRVKILGYFPAAEIWPAEIRVIYWGYHGRRERGWVWAQTGINADGEFSWRDPTHWMPLPKPPRASDEPSEVTW